MSDQPGNLDASTPAATAAAAQTRDEAQPAGLADAEVVAASDLPAGKNVTYKIGEGVLRAQYAYGTTRDRDDPLYRPLQIYTIDPSASRQEGAVTLVKVKYEPLEWGPAGAHFIVSSFDEERNKTYQQVDLDDPRILISNGRKPSPSDWLFHQQMTYAVCSLVYDAFTMALGRHITWGFDPDGNDTRNRLHVFPFGMQERNAYYERATKSIKFGYYPAKEVADRNVPNGWVFTSLSHDIVTHEVTHALLDGLRAHFLSPTGADVLAFHEAFADIVAVFQRFTYIDVVDQALRGARGDIMRANALTDLARQFGNTIGKQSPLRTMKDIGENDKPKQLNDAGNEPHDRGSVLASAIFDAFTTLFERKTRRYLRLATGGTGVLPDGEIPVDLRELLAEEASQLASQCLAICIRAIDYCPPVDIEFGEYLRAIITADYDLVPDDPWGYREAWVDTFWKRGIYPPDVANLSEDALLWHRPRHDIVIEALSYSNLAFRGDPNTAPTIEHLEAQACALGDVVTKPEYLNQFGLVSPGDLNGDHVDLPYIQSVRTSRRVGPDGQVVFDLIAEVTQRRVVKRDGAALNFYGGATVIIGPDGGVRYVIAKRVDNEARLKKQIDYMTGAGSAYWQNDNGFLHVRNNPLRMAHERNGQRRGLTDNNGDAASENNEEADG